jgi:hypothetical protein
MSKPIAFVMMPYREPYETVYKAAIEGTLTGLGFEVSRGDTISRSTPFTNDVFEYTRSSELIIADVSGGNENVYYELGYAHGLNKEVILLTHDSPEDLPADTRHIRHLKYDTGNLGELRKVLEEWVKKSSAHRLKSRKELAKTLKRGDIFEAFTDATFYLSTGDVDDRSDIINCIKNKTLIPTKYLYKYDRGCLNWLNLCNDAEYEYFRDSVAFFRESISDVLEAAGHGLLDSPPDYISLGPGNGKKDQIFLKKILDSQKGSNEEIYYYPFDISPMMISHAIRDIVRGLSPDVLKVKAIVGDFYTDLKSFEPVYQYRTATNLFTLLGNTLGNFENEVGFLDRMYQAMFPGDVLFIEVRLKASKEANPGGELDVNKRFDFTPLDLLGINYDAERLSYSTFDGRSTIAKTRTIVASYHDFVLTPGGEHIESAYLSYVHEYDREALLNVLKHLGFTLLRDFAAGGVLCAVLRKPPLRLSI